MGDGKEDQRTPWWHLVLGVLGSLLVILGVLYLYSVWINSRYTVLANRGLFGDKFGAPNALFSGLAFVGIIYAILLQRQELGLQRKELRSAVEESHRTTEALEKSNIEAAKSRSAQVFEQIVRILADIDADIYPLTRLKGDWNLWSEDENKLARRMADKFQRAAFLSLSEFVDSDYIIEGYAGQFATGWTCLSLWIEYSRELIGDDHGAYQYLHFEEFALRCTFYLDPRSQAKQPS